MQFFLLFLFLATFVFLFTLYWIGKDDLVLLRKNIALEQLFNITFIALGLGLFFSRLFYVIFHPSSQYLNPLVFLVFPYFPGLSLFGGILSVGIFLLYLKLSQKIPFTRIIDFYVLSLLTALPLGYIGQIFISEKKEHTVLLILSLFFIFMAAVFFLYVYPKLLANKIKEGLVTILFLLFFPIVSLLASYFIYNKGYFYFIGGEEIGNILTSILGLVLLCTHLISSKKQNTTGR